MKAFQKWENLWSKIRYISRFNLPACCHHNFSKSDRSEKSQPWADCYFKSQTFFFTKSISYSSHRIWGCWVDCIKEIIKYLYLNQIITDQILSCYNSTDEKMIDVLVEWKILIVTIKLYQSKMSN